MGYAGEESMYVSRAVLDAAYAASGLALDFYKSCLAACMFVSGPAFNSLSMRL